MISLVFEYSAQYGGSLNSMKFQEKTEVNNFSIKSKISVFPLHLLYAKLQKKLQYSSFIRSLLKITQTILQ